MDIVVDILKETLSRRYEAGEGGQFVDIVGCITVGGSAIWVFPHHQHHQKADYPIGLNVRNLKI